MAIRPPGAQRSGQEHPKGQKTPKGWKQYTFGAGSESVDIKIELPAGPAQAEAGVAAVRCQGPLGESRFKTGVGDIRTEQVGGAPANGDVRLGEVAHGTVTAQTASGSLEIGVSALC